MEAIIKITSIEKLTHDVLRITTEKPKDLTFKVGQAADISINKPDWEKELRAFTFTSLPEDDFLEFTIKTYPSHNGVTKELLNLTAGDELIISGVFGDIEYKGEGIFIAGGAGVTPFIAILKQLEKNNAIGNNKMIFANKTKADIILKDTLSKQLGNSFHNILSEEQVSEYHFGYITAELIKNYADETTKYYYLCGPDRMMEFVGKALKSLGIDEAHIVKEAF